MAAYRNRKLAIPDNAGELHEIQSDKEAALHNEILQRTEQFRYHIEASVKDKLFQLNFINTNNI